LLTFSFNRVSVFNGLTPNEQENAKKKYEGVPMLKSVMLVSAVAIAAPALSQTAAPPSTNAAQPAATPTAEPATATPSTTAQQPTAAATPAATATPSAAAQTTAPAASEAPAAPAAEQPANSADAVAAVVSADWSKYDADSDGNLSKTEFGAWMTALREQNPAQKAAVPDPEAWTTAAFAMADKDKSGAVNKDELAGFLRG
jgi:hypothetical protein